MIEHRRLRVPGSWRRNLFRLLVIGILAWGIHLVLAWLADAAQQGHAQPGLWMLAGLLLVYAMLIAVPFVPGVEVGLTLMAMEGPWITPWIYAATTIGLTTAFVAGFSMPYARLHRILADLHLSRACDFLDRVQRLDRHDRLRIVQDRAPGWLHPVASRFRYVLLAVLINLPGNAVIGGGGGLMFMAGFSRLFTPLATLLTIVAAVAPVPIMLWGFGVDLRSVFGL